MAINQNHTFDELDGIKCAIVEKNATPARVDFLRTILAGNGYTVVVVPTPPAKNADAEAPAPETFTIGVTDVTFNPTNAIYGRLLRNKDGHIITPAYWSQSESDTLDDTPYYDKH
ncbi:MAG: hypothetical protein R2794_08610 [Chitinophagales bacterium]